MTPRCPTLRLERHRGVKMHTADSESKNLLVSSCSSCSDKKNLLVNTTIMGESFEVYKVGFTKSKTLTPRCHSHRRVKSYNFMIEYLLYCLLNALVNFW